MSISINVDSPDLTAVEAQVIAALAAGKNVSQAAREAGIHRSTVYNWLHRNPAFAGLLDRTIQHHNTAVLDRAFELLDPAFDTLQHLIENEQVSPAVRFRAARLILEFAMSASPETNPEAVEQALPQPRPIERPAEQSRTATPSTTPRNAPCPCGSGVKFKRCCSLKNISPAAQFGETW